MQTVYLNGNFMPMEEAKISPLDRGFLFGDGIYEVIPCYDGKPVGLALHLQRMQNGLNEINLNYSVDIDYWRALIAKLLDQFTSSSLGVYIHVSRGADTKRFHAYPDNISPTVFAYGFEIPPSQVLDINKAKSFKVKTIEDLRWKRCHIKSTSLLGNVMHFQEGQNTGVDEVILYNDKKEITEAAACNVFIVKGKEVATPPLDNQLLPGITRHIILESLRKDGEFEVNERPILLDELFHADEVWISSSSKEIAPVVKVDEQLIGEGRPGDAWIKAMKSYNKYKFDL